MIQLIADLLKFLFYLLVFIIFILQLDALQWHQRLIAVTCAT